MFNPLDKFKSKLRYEKVMRKFLEERAEIKAAEEMRAALEAAKATEAEEAADVVDSIANVLSENLRPVINTNNAHRVTLDGADDMYGWIDESNYIKFVNGFSNLEKDEEFLFAMVLIDKCEEYDDAQSMVRIFNVFEFIVRHHKQASPTISFARQYIIEMRRYLTDLGLL